MSAITTHVLDTARGRPAAGVPVVLERRAGDRWLPLGSGTTDADGRLATLLAKDAALEAGTYRVCFDTAAYFTAHGVASFYPVVHVTFSVVASDEHYHVPLLLSPFGYSTYRGS